MRCFFFVILSIFVMAAAPQARAQNQTLEQAFLKSAFVYCVPPLIKGQNIAEFLDEEMNEVPLMSVTPGMTHAFDLPVYAGRMKLLVGEKGDCSVQIVGPDPAALWMAVDKAFVVENAFKKTSDTSIEGTTMREYEGRIETVPLRTRIIVTDKVIEGSIYGMITLARVE